VWVLPVPPPSYLFYCLIWHHCTFECFQTWTTSTAVAIKQYTITFTVDKKNWTCYICIINKKTYSSFEYSKFNRAALTSHCSSSPLVCSKEFPLQKTVPIKCWREEKNPLLVICYDTAIKFSRTIPWWINTEIGITVRNYNISFDHRVLSLTTTSCHFHPLLCHTFGLWLNEWLH
jgi:hypothetical protein